MGVQELRRLYESLFVSNTRLSAIAFRRAIRKDVKASEPKTLAELRLIKTDNLYQSMLDRYEKNGIKFGNNIYNDLRIQLQNKKRFNPLFSREWAKFVNDVYATELIRKIVSVKQTIVEEIEREVNNAIEQGDDMIGLTQTIEKVVNSNEFYMWQAERIARTEVGSAMNTATQKAVDELGVPVKKRWISSLDGRERPSHRQTNGETVGEKERFSNGLLRPHDPSAPASEVVNCYLPNNFIESNIISGQKSFYSGEALEIITRRGESITITPNHRILTQNGFIPAKDIAVGNNLVCNKFKKYSFVRFIDNYIKKKFFRVENVFSSLKTLWLSKTVKVIALDFDKDGQSMKGNINIVYPKVFLANRLKTRFKFFDSIYNFIFKKTSFIGVKVCGFGSFKLFCGRNNTTSNRIMSFLHLSFPLLFRHFRPLKLFTFGLASNLNIQRPKSSSQNASFDISFLRNLIKTNSRNISFDEVVDVRYFNYTGHVYDFTSINGVNIVNNIYTSNCRCVLQYIPL